MVQGNGVEVVVFDGKTWVSAADIVAIARGAPVQVADSVYCELSDVEEWIQSVIKSRKPVYGLNTALGHLKAQTIDEAQIAENQYRMLRLHNGAVGPGLPAEQVRAAMAARLVGMCKRSTAASPRAVRLMAGMLNAGVHPIVPRVGSVGAGDLGNMAAIGCAMIAEGKVEYRGAIMPASTALASAELEPLVQGPRDGLVIVAGNGFSIGAGTLLVAESNRIADIADIVLAMSLENIRGNLSVLHPALDKGIAGQARSSANIRTILRGSYLENPGAAKELQDPLSFRVAPNTHGALRETTDFLTRAVEAELNADAHNPSLVGEEFVHNGNFQPMFLTAALEALRPALVHLAKLSERRVNHVVADLMHDENFVKKELGSSFSKSSILFLYSSAALTAEARQLAAPASLDCPPLDFNIEDHGSNAPLAAQRGFEVIACLDSILAVEAMIATELQPPGSMDRPSGRGAAVARDAVYSTMSGMESCSSPSENHAAVVALLRDGLVSQVAKAHSNSESVPR